MLAFARPAFLVAAAALVDGLALLRASARPAHDDAVLLDDVPWVGTAVLLALDAAAGLVVAIERVCVALLPRRSGLLALAEEPPEHR